MRDYQIVGMIGGEWMIGGEMAIGGEGNILYMMG